MPAAFRRRCGFETRTFPLGAAGDILWYTVIMIITISGKPGSGKGTVAKMLAKKLRYRYFSIGEMRRAMAKERGMSLEAFNRLGEKQGFTDREIDAWQQRQGKKLDNAIFEGRTSFHFIPHSVKLFFDVNLNEASRRIANDGGHWRRFEVTTAVPTKTAIRRALMKRIASDSKRYRKYYGLDIFDRKHYDLVLNTTKMTPKEAARAIFIFLAKIKEESRNVHKLRIKKGPYPQRVHK